MCYENKRCFIDVFLHSILKFEAVGRLSTAVMPVQNMHGTHSTDASVRPCVCRSVRTTHMQEASMRAHEAVEKHFSRVGNRAIPSLPCFIKPQNLYLTRV